jgi:hypothetical protein
MPEPLYVIRVYRQRKKPGTVPLIGHLLCVSNRVRLFKAETSILGSAGELFGMAVKEKPFLGVNRECVGLYPQSESDN